jgi:hypothetical protein
MVVKFGGGVDDLIWKTKGHGLGYLSRQQALLFFFSVFSSRLSRPSRRQIVVKGERYLGIGRCDRNYESMEREGHQLNSS